MSENSTRPEQSSMATAQVTTDQGSWIRNLVVVAAATVLVVTIVLGIRTQSSTASLTELAETAAPYEVALTNGKPTLLEFYANWCTSCQAMAGDMAELRTQYADQVNFVMLNVDNNKWLPEMLSYRVDGIPHFVYLDDQGEPISMAIGELPRLIIAENLDALIAHQALPHGQSRGRTSDLASDPLTRQTIIDDDPRSHGGQVK